MVEQLVEVPTILTPSFLRMLQNADTPVPHVVVELLKVFNSFSLDILPFLWEQTVDIPAPRSGVRRLRVSTAFGEADHRFPAVSVVQIIDNPAPGGGLQDLRPGQSSVSSSHSPADLADGAFQGVFRTFPQNKKVRHYLRTRGRKLPPHSSPRTPAACDVPMALEEEEEERSPRTSLTSTSSTWSLICTGGGASGSRLVSSVAGGWPRRVGHRPAIRCGGPRGSSAEGQGDWGLVRQWIHGLRQLLGACAVLYFFSM